MSLVAVLIQYLWGPNEVIDFKLNPLKNSCGFRKHGGPTQG